jgi:hypothetical protein
LLYKRALDEIGMVTSEVIISETAEHVPVQQVAHPHHRQPIW